MSLPEVLLAQDFNNFQYNFQYLILACNIFRCIPGKMTANVPVDLSELNDACESSVPRERDAIEIAMDSSSLRHWDTTGQQEGSEASEAENEMIVTGTDETDLQIKTVMKRLAHSIARMEVINPEVLRVTPAFQAFQQFGAALRPRQRGSFYHKSRESHKISTFWSHSWRGGQWKKLLTLVTFYNGTAAVSLGFLASILVMLLFLFGLLPGLERKFGHLQVKWSCWSLCSGCIVTSLAMIFWRPQTEVFLDRICISQVGDLKAQAIFSLAGMLQKSDKLLILWDPTWTERLWCLFELAAFLQSKKTQNKTLIIRPIFLGPVSMVLFLAMFVAMLPGILVSYQFSYRSLGAIYIPIAAILLLGLASSYPCVSTLRKYFRDLDAMRQQLLSISFSTAHCSCCALGHVGPSGEATPCDRKIVKECVKIWFGSEQAFEDTVRSEILEILNHDLNEKVFSTPWLLGVTAPSMWLFLDISSSWAFISDWKIWEGPPAAVLLEGLVIWLLAVPATKDLILCFCRMMRARPRSLCLEVLKNMMTLFFMFSPLAMITICYGLIQVVVVQRMHRAAAFLGCMLLLSPCNFLLAVGLKALLKRPGW